MACFDFVCLVFFFGGGCVLFCSVLISLRAIQAFNLNIVQTIRLGSALCPCTEVASSTDLD